jgi:hypothetical protein
MSARCQDLDLFFDGELSKDDAQLFRAHLVFCVPCQRVLCGRVQEEIVVQSGPGREQRPRVVAVELPQRAVRRRRAVALAGLLAAAFAIWLIARPSDDAGRLAMPEGEEATGQDRALELVSSIEHRDTGMRGPTTQTTSAPSEVGLKTTLAHAGDVLQLRVRGERHRALWVYRGPRELVAACPGDPRCLIGDSELSLALPLEAVGLYWAVALGSSKPILEPAARVEAVQSTATSAGARYVMRAVSVN